MTPHRPPSHPLHKDGCEDIFRGISSVDARDAYDLHVGHRHFVPRPCRGVHLGDQTRQSPMSCGYASASRPSGDGVARSLVNRCDKVTLGSSPWMAMRLGNRFGLDEYAA